MTDAVPAERDTPFTRHKALFYTLRVLRECVPSLVLASSVYFLFVKLFQQVYGPDFEGTTFVQECMFPGKHLMYDKALWMTTLKNGLTAEYYPNSRTPFVNLTGIQAVDVYSRNWERVPDWKDGGTANDWICVAFKPGSPFYSQLN